MLQHSVASTSICMVFLSIIAHFSHSTVCTLAVLLLSSFTHDAHSPTGNGFASAPYFLSISYPLPSIWLGGLCISATSVVHWVFITKQCASSPCFQDFNRLLITGILGLESVSHYSPLIFSVATGPPSALSAQNLLQNWSQQSPYYRPMDKPSG